MTLKNSKELFNINRSQKDKIEEINNLVRECTEKAQSMERIRTNCFSMMQEVMKNFYPKREVSEIWLPNEEREFDKKREPLFISAEEFEKKRQDYYYYERLCIHPEGLSFLGIWAENSVTLFKMREAKALSYLIGIKNNDKVLYYLKEKLKDEKYKILETILKDVEKINFNTKKRFNKEIIVLDLDHNGEVSERKTQIVDVSSYNGLSIRLSLSEQDRYNDDTLQFPIGINDLIPLRTLEQIYEEVTCVLSEYKQYLEEILLKVKDYEEYLKKNFLRQLILLNLKPVKGGDV